MEMLKNVYYKLEENHQAGLSELFEELEAEGICRIVAGERNKSWQNREAVSGSHGDTVISDALLITDDCRLAEQAETEGIACLASRIQTGILPVPRWYCRICWMWMCRC